MRGGSGSEGAAGQRGGGRQRGSGETAAAAAAGGGSSSSSSSRGQAGPCFPQRPRLLLPGVGSERSLPHPAPPTLHPFPSTPSPPPFPPTPRTPPAARPPGIGKDHAKWQPVATAAYQFLPTITIDAAKVAALSDAQKAELCDADPRKTFRLNQLTKQVRGAAAGRVGGWGGGWGPCGMGAPWDEAV